MLPFALLVVQTGACEPVPPSLSGWTTPTPVKAGTRAAVATPLPIGVAAAVGLARSTDVALAAPAHKPAAPATSGGLLAISVPTAARYRVALGAAAWIDLIRDGRPLASTAHAHGPACSTIRKMVDFDLTPGRYLLQIVGSAAPTVTVKIARLD
nr:homogentisate 1,2-dioxygenase [Sphingomonas sp. MA1305]